MPTPSTLWRLPANSAIRSATRIDPCTQCFNAAFWQKQYPPWRSWICKKRTRRIGRTIQTIRNFNSLVLWNQSISKKLRSTTNFENRIYPLPSQDWRCHHRFKATGRIYPRHVWSIGPLRRSSWITLSLRCCPHPRTRLRHFRPESDGTRKRSNSHHWCNSLKMEQRMRPCARSQSNA